MNDSERTIERVLVAGATGPLGRAIVERLQQASLTVRALVRDASQARFIMEPGQEVELVEGDVRQPWTLTAACAGVQAVICAVGARSLFGLGGNAPRAVDFHGVKNLANAACQADVQHFVLVSSIMVTRPSFLFELVSGRVLTQKRKGEAALRASGLAYTIIRPGGLTPATTPSASIILEQGDKVTGQISRADVADLCVRALQQPASRGKTFEAVGREGAPAHDPDDLFSVLMPD